MEIINLSPQILEFLRIAVIIFTLFHFFTGAVLIFQINKMNSILKTSNAGCFTLIGYMYLMFLVMVLVLVIIF